MSAKRPISLLLLGDDQGDGELSQRRLGRVCESPRGRTSPWRGSKQPGPGVRTVQGPAPRSKVRSRPDRPRFKLRDSRVSACRRATSCPTSTLRRPAALPCLRPTGTRNRLCGMDRKFNPIPTRGPTRGTDLGTWAFRVKDDGIGIAFENQQRFLATLRGSRMPILTAVGRSSNGISTGFGRMFGPQLLYPSLGPNRNPSGAAPSLKASVLEFHYAH
jgi:hypothetical protein